MGKAKKKRTRPYFEDPTGSSNEHAVTDTDLHTENLSTVTHVIENLQSTNADERECGCAMLATVLTQQGSIQQLLAGQIVKIVGPLMVDSSFSVRQNAVGALRNMSVEGGCEACVEMIRQDIMTPLIMLLQEYGSDWHSSDEKKKIEDLKQGTFLQAVHLLWNLCESSETAVQIFTQQKVVSILLPCLQPDVYGTDMAVAVGQCLHTVTENNPELVSQMAGHELVALVENIISRDHHNSQEILLHLLATGILYNISAGTLGSASGDLLLSVVRELSLVLEHDTSAALLETMTLIVKEKEAKDDGEECSPDISDPTLTKNDKLEACIQDLLNLLLAQSIAVEMTANLCCPDDDEDEDWEDLDSDGGSCDDASSVGEVEMDAAAASGALPPLCVPSEVHTAFLANSILSKVLSKTGLPDTDICNTLNTHKKGQRILRSLYRLQACSLLCVNNMVSAMEASALGGAEQLQTVFRGLSQLATTQTVLNNPDLLGAVTTALRAVAQKLAESGCTEFSALTEQDFHFLFEMSRQCADGNVRVNGIRVVATIGTCLARNQTPHPYLKDIGLFLLECAGKDEKLWVVAEAIDAILDVFAEDHVDSVVREIGVVEKLKVLAPCLKQKIKQERLNLGEHMPIISTARTNLIRFIKYKQTH